MARYVFKSDRRLKLSEDDDVVQELPVVKDGASVLPGEPEIPFHPLVIKE